MRNVWWCPGKGWLALVGLLLSGVWLMACAGQGDTLDPDSPNNPKNAAPDSITPLSKDSFVFLRYDAKGNAQIFQFDTKTNKSSLIHDLMSANSVPTNTPTIALSPDRKWVAMTGLFRPNKKELELGKAVKSLWKISVDGKQVLRLSDPLPLVRGRECKSDNECADLKQVCDQTLQQCTRRNYSVGISSPAWSNDGSRVFVVFSQFWTGETGRMEGGATLASVSSSGGTMELPTLDAGCQQVTSPSFHPQNNTLVAYHSVCSGGLAGLHLHDASFSAKGKKLISSSTVRDQLGKVAWLPDGSGFFFLASTTWDTNNDGQPDLEGTGIALYKTKDGTLQGAIPPLKKELLFRDFSVSPNNDAFVLCIRNSQTNTSDLYWFPLSDKGESRQLTTDGKSCAPSW